VYLLHYDCRQPPTCLSPFVVIFRDVFLWRIYYKDNQTNVQI